MDHGEISPCEIIMDLPPLPPLLHREGDGGVARNTFRGSTITLSYKVWVEIHFRVTIFH
jgi:hypothetical protein